jgi:phage gpG-like protein
MRAINTLPWRQAGGVVKESVQENFIIGGSPSYGGKWKPRKVDQLWPILRKSDTLMNSIYVEPVPNGVAIGTRVPYQAVHNFGYPARNITQRKYLFAKNKDIITINAMFKKHLRKSRA